MAIISTKVLLSFVILTMSVQALHTRSHSKLQENHQTNFQWLSKQMH